MVETTPLDEKIFENGSKMKIQTENSKKDLVIRTEHIKTAVQNLMKNCEWWLNPAQMIRIKMEIEKVMGKTLTELEYKK